MKKTNENETPIEELGIYQDISYEQLLMRNIAQINSLEARREDPFIESQFRNSVKNLERCLAPWFDEVYNKEIEEIEEELENEDEKETMLIKTRKRIKEKFGRGGGGILPSVKAEIIQEIKYQDEGKSISKRYGALVSLLGRKGMLLKRALGVDL